MGVETFSPVGGIRSKNIDISSAGDVEPKFTQTCHNGFTRVQVIGEAAKVDMDAQMMSATEA